MPQQTSEEDHGVCEDGPTGEGSLSAQTLHTVCKMGSTSELILATNYTVPWLFQV